MIEREETERRRRLWRERARSASTGKAALQEKAALWALRLAGDSSADAPVDWEALSVWLEREPAARAALDAAETALEVVRGADRREFAAGLTRHRTQARAKSVRLRLTWVLGAGAVAAAMAGIVIETRAPEATVWQAPRTSTLQVALNDGTKITLDRASRLEVLFASRQREARLSPGSHALFDVAHDPSRPFRIALGTNAIRVLGTLFDVDDTPGGLDVSVARGTVEVSGSRAARSIRVRAGERLTRGRDGRAVLTRVAAHDVGAWRSGELTYVDAPLALLAGDLGRYWGQPVMLGAGAERLRFTGVLVIDDPAVMATTLRRLAPITVLKTRDGFVLQRREAGS